MSNSMEKETTVLQLFQGRNEKKEEPKKNILQLLNGVIDELNKGELKEFTQACVILTNDRKEGEEDLIMINTDISPIKMVGLLELIKLKYIETNV